MITSLLVLAIAVGGLFIILGAAKFGTRLVLASLMFTIFLPLLVCLGAGSLHYLGGWGSIATLSAIMLSIGRYRVHHAEEKDRLLRQSARAKWHNRELKRRIERVS